VKAGLGWITLCLGLMMGSLAYGVIETYEFSRPELAERYHRLSQELRCPKCQNQNIADSNAPISRDLRALLHKKLEDGASDQEILDYMVERYGEFVRYRPRMAGETAVLWYAPAVLTLLVGLGLILHWRRQRHSVVTRAPDPAEVARLRRMLDEGSTPPEEPR